MEILDILRFLLLLSVLIFVHEGGHFLLAKLAGVKVEEFGFGIPPRLWGRKWGDTLYSLNLLPIGGFVRLKGEEAGETLGFGSADSFAVKSKLKRVGIIAAGALGNLVLAWVLFSVLWGVGNLVPAGKVLVSEVLQGSPAQTASIKEGDFILSLSGMPTEGVEELVKLTQENVGKTVVLAVESAGEVKEVTVLARSQPPAGEGPIGFAVETATKEVKLPFWKAPIAGLVTTFESLGMMIKGIGTIIGNIFRGEEVAVGGPVAIYALTAVVADGGVKPFLSFMAILSLNLVVVNLLPIPALDGGRILFIGIEALRRKRLSPKTEQLINSLGFALLIVLILLLSIRDLNTFF
ncbi:MAG: M50 family metallopeptidase [Patescibacteria group bacterium]